MITPQDDLIGHQLPTTFDHVVSSDTKWMERQWFCGHHVPEGDVMFELGMGWHPNQNVIDGFAGVTVGRTQYNFRVSRHLRPHPLITEIGPLKITSLEGLKRHRLRLESNDSPISFDVELLATAAPHEESNHFRRRNGRVVEDLFRYSQTGCMKGWLDVAGKRYEISPETWWAQRDHSWGVRQDQRTDPAHPPLTKYPPFFYVWSTYQTPTRAIHLFFNERAVGNKIYLTGEEIPKNGGKGSRLVDVSHDFVFAKDPLGQSLERATFHLKFRDGSIRDLHLKPLGPRYFQAGGCYGGINNWYHGDDKGPFYCEHDVWDLDNEAHRRIARTLSDTVVEIRYDGEVGYGIIEFGVAKGFDAFHEVQDFSPM